MKNRDRVAVYLVLLWCCTFLFLNEGALAQEINDGCGASGVCQSSAEVNTCGKNDTDYLPFSR